MQMAAAYIRVSTEEQVEFSPDSQLKAIRDYAKKNNYILPEEFIFIDEGISGRSAEKRPEFMNMISIAKTKPKPFDAILLWKFSRFARNREDSIVFKSMLRKECGISVISITEPLSDDKTSMLIEALLESMDEYYSINLSEEVKRGMAEKASRGGVVSAPPFGYIIKDNNYIIDEERAEIVRMIFHDYANGMGYREIANKLNDMGVQTKRGNAWDNRGVEYVLNNPVYIGKIRWSKNGPTVSRRIFNSSDTMIVDSNHEPIIDKELFDTVADIMAANKKKHTKYARAALPTDYLFKGLLRCSNCGSTLVQSAKGYFQCHNYAKGKCNTSHSISFNKIQSAIINQLKVDLKNNTFNINFKITHYDNNDLILKQIEKEKQKLKRVKQAYEAGIDTLEEYRENKLNITAAIENLESKILKASNKNKKINDLKNKITDAIYLLENDFTPLSEKNALLKEFIEKIIYNKHEQTLYLYYFV